MKNIFQFINALLNFLGLRIIKIRRERSAHQPDVRISRLEKKIIKRKLKEYVQAGRGGAEHYQTYRSAAKYLSMQRVKDQKTAAEFLVQSGVRVRSGSWIVDFGCGLGFFLSCLKESYPAANLMGVDPSEKSKVCVPIMCPSAMVREALPAEVVRDLQPIDLIVLQQVLEHQLNPSALLERTASLISQEGTLFISVPNGRVDTLPSGRFLPALGAYTGHINFWSRESLQRFLSGVFPGRQVSVHNQGPNLLFALIRPSAP